MSSMYITPENLKTIAQDGEVTAVELLYLVNARLNGSGSPDNAVEGWTTPFVDLMQYSFAETAPIMMTAPAEGATSVTLKAGTLKSADGNYSLSLTTASASSTETPNTTGATFSDSAALKFSLTAPNGVTFSIDFSDSDSSTWTQATGAFSGSGKDSLTLSFKDTKGTTQATDDISIVSTYTTSFTYSNNLEAVTDTRTYNYLGNGFTINQKDQAITSTRN